MPNRFFAFLLLLSLSVAVLASPTPPELGAGGRPTASFGVAAHGDVNIEWWYVNAHVTTDKGRHLALVGSFFRFGTGVSPFDGVTPVPRAHYLIYAVTDLDKKTQRPYSLADSHMIALLKQFGPLLAMQNPKDKGVKAFLAAVNQGRLPAPHQKIAGQASVTDAPFRIAYGKDNTLTATNATDTAFDLNLDAGGRDKIHLTLASQKPPMAVGGKGETGLKSPTDMYYFSLTRCAVGGTIDTGAGPEQITGGQGWFDHQWGNSWVASNNGWDWWGVQLDDGTDILFFRQRDLKTGRVFFPLATFMDKDGHQSVTRKIVFTSYPLAYWRSAKSGVTYPLAWKIYFPEQKVTLLMKAAVMNQEMPILGPGAGIWEGLCYVQAFQGALAAQVAAAATNKNVFYFAPYGNGAKDQLPRGVAYMELVGYNSPAVKKQLAQKTTRP